MGFGVLALGAGGLDLLFEVFGAWSFDFGVGRNRRNEAFSKGCHTIAPETYDPSILARFWWRMTAEGKSVWFRGVCFCLCRAQKHFTGFIGLLLQCLRLLGFASQGLEPWPRFVAAFLSSFWH